MIFFEKDKHIFILLIKYPIEEVFEINTKKLKFRVI